MAGMPQPRWEHNGQGSLHSLREGGQVARLAPRLENRLTVPAWGTLGGPQQAMGFDRFSNPSMFQIFKIKETCIAQGDQLDAL